MQERLYEVPKSDARYKSQETCPPRRVNWQAGNVPSRLRSKSVEIQWKYTRNKPSKLGEIVNFAASSTYFTELPAAAGISILFPFNYFTKRSGVYFYSISTLFHLIISRSWPAAAGISTVFLLYFYLK
jgi:hypothetical protein